MTKRCLDCRFHHSDGTSLHTCSRKQMLEWERNPPKPKMDYVHGRMMEFVQCFPLIGGCQENREDQKKCGPRAQWFEEKAPL